MHRPHAHQPMAASGGPGRLPEALVELYGLAPLPREGGRFRRTWAGPERADGRPEGSAIVMLLTAEPGDYCALHRLPADEIWHFYLGDPLTLLLLPEEGAARSVVLGPDVLGGQQVQFTVPAGTWMGAAVAEGGRWTLFGCTMAPGFTFDDYEHGDAAELAARFPQEAARITALSRP
ncbi:cupin domain-containing protein [Streptomyces halobius]|uniref:Cupin domain-containing protein n=2 Tax=Streptomyces halobius TaxID=2879846 RepID=A0ABY4ME42_9ACTN|nr:cupin domain-containing protein [Streptomyces halobius]UQA94606.1 cupin domain-containing protein [Streptomyces halobius]